MSELNIAPETQAAIETLLRALTDQLKTTRTGTALALDYIDHDNHLAVMNTLLSIEVEIEAAACLLKSILALYRSQRANQ